MKPTRPYKNIEELRKQNVSVYVWDKKHDTGFWPCPTCGGSGKVHNEKDRDVVEGYKMAPLYTCMFCGGKGTATKEYWRAIYRIKMNKWREECKEYDHAKKLIKSAKSKLTPEEIKALGI
jgi:RecJ-like exonuclease